MKRLFIAVDLAIPVVEELVAFQRRLQALIDDIDGVRVKWTRPEHIHLTMKFLGNTEPAMLPVLREAIAELVGPLFPFEVEARGVGFFPGPHKPRIIWSGFDDESAEVLSLLHRAIERDLGEIGIEQDDKPFRPHVTLGRVKSRKRPDFTRLVDQIERRSYGKSYIKDIILYESKLDHEGPHYTVVDRFALGR